MFCPAPASEEVRDWQHHIKQRKLLNKQLKDVGKKFLNERGSGRVSGIQERLEHVLKLTDASNINLMQYVRPFLNDNAMLSIFSYERLKRENESLKKENSRLKNEKQVQKQRLEQTIKNNNLKYHEEQKLLYKKNAELKNYCEYLENKRDSLKNVKTTHSTHTDPLISQNIDVNKFIELSYKTKEQRFEETLKTQNILIEDLKVRLENSEKEIENLKLLNRELTKQNNQRISDEEKISKQDNIKFENEKRKTQEYKYQLLDFQQKYEDSQRLTDKQEIDLNHLRQQLQQISREKTTLQYSILKYEAEIKNCNTEINSIKLQNQLMEQQIKKKDSIIERLSYEVQSLKKKQSEEILHPVPVPRKSDAGLTQKKSEDYSKKEEPSPTESAYESKNEEDDPYVQKCLQKLADICENTSQLEKEVDKFSGTEEDQDFYHLKELLIRNIVKLDNVETEGYLIIREKRRMAIRFVQKVIDTLKGKAT